MTKENAPIKICEKAKQSYIKYDKCMQTRYIWIYSER